MKRGFEDVLAECLEALTSGERTVEECLALYPRWSDRLEPLLRLGSRLGRDPLLEPEPAFQKAARERFLSAARARAAASRPARRFPSFTMPGWWRWRPALSVGWHRTAFGATAAVLIVFLGFSSFVVASAGDSLPGDWRYPVKQLTERTRLTFTFGENARRNYRISLAEERLHEVRELAARDRPIGETVLRRLVDTTEPLVEALGPSSVPADQIQRITDLTADQGDVLDSVAPLVKEEAEDELDQAMVVSSEGHEKALDALATALAEQPPEETPGLTTPGAGTPTVQPDASSTAESTPGSSATAEASGTPEPGEATTTPTAQPTLIPGEATIEPTEPTPVPDEPTIEPPTPTATPEPEHQLVSLPDDTTAGLEWNLLVIGDFSMRVPAQGSGAWTVSSLTVAPGERILIGHRLGGVFDGLILVKVGTGEASIQVLVGGTLWQVRADEVRSLVSESIADVILHVLESISPSPP